MITAVFGCFAVASEALCAAEPGGLCVTAEQAAGITVCVTAGLPDDLGSQAQAKAGPADATGGLKVCMISPYCNCRHC